MVYWNLRYQVVINGRNDVSKPAATPTQSLAGYIRDNLASIEGKLFAGFRQEAIIAELPDFGFVVTPLTFRVALHRARNRAKTTGNYVRNTSQIQEKKSQINAESKSNTTVEKHKKTDQNPLTKRVGFDFKPASDDDVNDLI